jgi:amino acid permease
MNKLIFLVLLVGGIVLIVYGVIAADSLGSDLSRFFTGSPTDKTIWLLIVGALAAIVGAGGLLRGGRTD